MKRVISIFCMLAVLTMSVGCGRETETLERDETTVTTATTAAEETAESTTAEKQESSETTSKVMTDSTTTTTASTAAAESETSGIKPAVTKPVVTNPAVTNPVSTGNTGTTKKTTPSPTVTKPVQTNPTAPVIVQTTPIQTQNPPSTHTALTVPSVPQTDTETKTEPILGTVKIVNGIMVVDSGTAQARALEIFSGSFKTGTRYAQALNRYKAALGENVNVYCMVVPTSAAFYMPDSHAGKYGNQLNNYNNIAASLDGVIGVPVYSAISQHTSEYLYSRTDYHWQPLAAYYAGEQFAMTAGVPYATLDTYTPVVREGYVGAFYAVNKVRELSNAPDTFTYYKPANLDRISCTYYNTAFGNARKGSLFFEKNSIGASYTVFVGTDNCILQVDTDVDNGRVLVIFKDSYGNALVPFLTQSFSKIYLCDFRYFDRNAISFAQQVGATDMLFAMSTVACTTSSKVGLVEKNLVK